MCNQLVAEATIVDEQEPAEIMNEAHLFAQADTSVVPVAPTLIPLSKVSRSVIRSELAASREESSLALVQLRNPTFRSLDSGMSGTVEKEAPDQTNQLPAGRSAREEQASTSKVD